MTISIKRCAFFGVAYVCFSGVMAWAHHSYQTSFKHSCSITFENGAQLKNLPLADTEKLQEIGLSKRETVSPGMVFIWPTDEPRRFWMKDTWQPLSIGFFNTNGALFDIQDMQANSEEVHASSNIARGAIEVPKGSFDNLGIDPGTRIQETDCFSLSEH